MTSEKWRSNICRPGQLARPIQIGNDRAETSEVHSDISGAHIWSCKYKKIIDLQIFSRIGKTMKKLYGFQKLPQHQHTYIYILILDVYISEGVKTALSTHGLTNI